MTRHTENNIAVRRRMARERGQTRRRETLESLTDTVLNASTRPGTENPTEGYQAPPATEQPEPSTPSLSMARTDAPR